MRPIAFGLAWFLIASLPTSLFPLAEVENDHRMYFPFVGLTFAVCWAAALLIEHRHVRAKILVPVCALILAGFALGARERNKVWSTEESLWHDVTVKSPNNGRGLMNYGLSQMEKGNYKDALDYFQRALVLNPNYYILEINLGIANGAVGNAGEAERHFLRSIQLAPTEASARYFYARWLVAVNRGPEALEHLKVAVAQNPDYVTARYLIMQIDSTMGDAASLRKEALETLARFPSDATAASWLSRAANVRPSGLPVPAPAPVTADDYLNLSLSLYRQGKYADCITAAQKALKIRPDYAEAWNNIGAAWNSMSQWDQGIGAARQAIRLKPDFQLAKNNLAWAESQKLKSEGSPPRPQ
jgi:protein O-mannosyl-transferase